MHMHSQQNLLSPKDLAVAIGVSESSLKRWADDGRLQAARTAGGHRRIALPEALRFIRETRATVVRPDVLGLPELAAVQAGRIAPGARASELKAALEASDTTAARALILSMFVGGMSVAALADGPIKSALHDIGEEWKHGSKGILVEHRAVDVCLGAVSVIRSLLPEPPASAPVALGGAPSEDPYILPSLLASIVLWEVGYRSVNLGPDTPTSAIHEGVVAHRPVLVWLSCSAPISRAKFEQVVKGAAPVVQEAGAKLVIGGRSVMTMAPPLPVEAHYALSMSELAAFAKGVAVAAQSRIPASGAPAA